jgi:hypothetical protein
MILPGQSGKGQPLQAPPGLNQDDEAWGFYD